MLLVSWWYKAGAVSENKLGTWPEDKLAYKLAYLKGNPFVSRIQIFELNEFSEDQYRKLGIVLED